MANVFEIIRKMTTFFLAVFLWLHAFLFLNVQSTLISRCTQLLHLTTSEVVLFGLLFIFSCLTASGFWKTLLSLAYIYLFPFVLLAYAFYGCFVIVRAINKWFRAQIGETQRLTNTLVVEQKATLVHSIDCRDSRHRRVVVSRRRFGESGAKDVFHVEGCTFLRSMVKKD